MRSSNRKTGNCFKIIFFYLSLLIGSGCTLTAKHADNTAVYRCTDCAPERIILNLTEDPSKSQAVTWRTCCAIDAPEAQIAPAAVLPDFKGSLITTNAAIEAVKMDRGYDVYHYSAVFRNLEPATTYAYRVGSAGNWSEWNQFETSARNLEPFAFVYFGDPQEHLKSMCSRIFREAYKKASDANFWFFIGDLVDNGDKDEEWAEFFYALGWIPRMTPMIMLPGNHEYPDKRYVQGDAFKLFPLWRPHFTLPENGPQGLEETTYFIDYQGVRFVMLNGNEKIEKQAEWLGRNLSENTQRWTIVGIHQPVYSTGKIRKVSSLRDLLVPVFDKYSVDLVLQGHDHTYCRTHKVRNGIKVNDNEKGTVYVVSVSGPKFYEVGASNKALMARMEKGRQLFQVIRIDRDRLIYESFDASGNLFDTFALAK
jgi:predicted MPP superfamily phosphohydrolase